MKQVELVNGDLRFPALMAGDGEPVILLHGFPDSFRNWRHQVQALADAGYLAVAPALRGYAPGCQPRDGDYSLRAAVDDVCGFAAQLGGFAAQLGGCAHLVGHDWGAVVGYLAAARSPEQFSSLTTLAIPPLKRLPAAVLKVPEQLLLSAYMEFFQLPLVPEWTLRRNDLAGIEWLWRRWSPDWEPGEYLAEAQAVLGEPGVMRAALNWYRHLPRVWSGAHREARRWMARPIEVPAMVMVGRKDGCMSPRLLEHTIHQRDFPAGLRVEQVSGAGHFLHLERPQRINDLLLQHLAASPSACAV